MKNNKKILWVLACLSGLTPMAGFANDYVTIANKVSGLIDPGYTYYLGFVAAPTPTGSILFDGGTWHAQQVEFPNILKEFDIFRCSGPKVCQKYTVSPADTCRVSLKNPGKDYTFTITGKLEVAGNGNYTISNLLCSKQVSHSNHALRKL